MDPSMIKSKNHQVGMPRFADVDIEKFKERVREISYS